ncbi:MGH1-like glycoside hydrolase domain-containing protein [Streptosporangium subroseum]|uniref:MGH1-like glycoside hydrolase domain-containing protein n=1 Tax=Streptosporangium subroseum TaxID=106412 RepID=UPI00308D1FDF|nr:trehalase family glycosidase [Streptosporangium subroseum]
MTAGWNTWDVTTHTGMVHLPSGLRIRFGVPGAPLDGFTWRDGLVRLGPHTVDGSYAEVTVEAGGGRLHLVMAGGSTDALYVRAKGTAGVLVVLDGWRDTDVAADRGLVRVGGELWRVDGSVPAEGLVLEFADEVDLYVAPEGVPGGARDVGAVLDRRRAEAERTAPRSGGWLGDAAAAATRAVTWNTIYAPDLGRVLTPTSRDFVSARRKGFYGSWALHAWDTFFTGLVASTVDRDYAREIFGQILPFADAAGMIPNRVSDDGGTTADRSQPPVGALTVRKAYLASGLSDDTRDRALLTGTFPALLAWHDWWLRARRGPHGLLAWGSDPVPGDPGSATLDRAKRESGLDDSPMYDDAAYDPETHTMDLTDVGLVALHIADADALAEIADVLGETDVAQRLRAEATAARAAADPLLWDTGRGGYQNLRADGKHDPHVSPTMLYPLLAGMPDAERAAGLVARLLRSETLGGDPPLPSTARDDPGYAATYWRGRIWAPMAFLAIEGLRRYELTEASRSLVAALLRLFLSEWDTHSHVRENYPATSGEDVRALQARSDGLMAWGGLLAYLAYGELADARQDGWRFAHPGEPAELANLPLGDGRLAVVAGDRLTVALDGRPLLDAAPDVVVTAYRRTADEVTGIVRGSGDLHVSPPGAGDPVRVPVTEEPKRFRLYRNENRDNDGGMPA